jgi:hypothetical protein
MDRCYPGSEITLESSTTVVNLNPAPTIGGRDDIPSVKIDLAASGLTSSLVRFSRKRNKAFSKPQIPLEGHPLSLARPTQRRIQVNQSVSPAIGYVDGKG